MSESAERLVVLLEARVRDFERNMQRASGQAGTSFNRMRRDSRSATQQMERDMLRSTTRINQALASTSTQIGVLARSFAAGFAGGVFAGGLAGAQRAVRSIVSELSEMGKEIDRVGLSAKVFQELKFGFGEAGVEASEFTTGMEQFNRRIGEAATRGGRLAEIFKANGIALRDQAGNIRSNEALLRDYANLVKNAGSEQERMTLATEAFGRGGAAFVLALRNGADGFDDMAEAAANAGGVIDEELIRKAEELDDRWAASWRNFEVNAKSAIMNVISTLDNMSDHLETIYRWMNDIGNSSFFRWLLTKMDDAGLITIDLNYGNIGAMDAADDLAAMQKRVSDLSQHVEHLLHIGEDAAAAEQQLAEARARLNAAVRAITSGGSGDTVLPSITVSGDDPPKTKIPGSGGRSGGGARNSAASAALREAEAVQNLIDSLTHELSLIGMSDAEKAEANALRQAGAAATDEQRQQIEMLVQAIHDETEALKASEAAQRNRTQAMSNMFQMGEEALLAMLDNSQKAEDAIKRLVIQLALAAAQAALLGTGPLAGLFGGAAGGGSILGGIGKIFGFSEGTANTGGARGEPRGIVHGQEAVIPLPNNRKVPVHIEGGASAGGGETRVKVDVGVSVDKNGNLQAFVRDVSEETAGTLVRQGIGEYRRGMVQDDMDAFLRDPRGR
ncbi:hypothetical protein GTW25_05915 [Aliihoeflea aestuarii]|uniref:hypothetical protein n=1 Tax=Aliihoeflea aestuarii TaxID=453840 RepID=UPI0020930E79|nr:hypothetical protein [Aliihoeflea aestuarii]MCO6390562.1 hypothetical protein [Aliihoeflea aestuarii]